MLCFSIYLIPSNNQSITLNMKIKSLLFAVVAIIIGSASMSAQTAKEVRETVARMESSSAQCNKGPEAFKTFIAKFSTDEDFMNSRINLEYEAKRTEFAELFVPSNFTAKEPFAKDGDMYYQSWGELQYQKTYLDCGWVDSYVTHTFKFERINGKWYLRDIIADE